MQTSGSRAPLKGTSRKNGIRSNHHNIIEKNPHKIILLESILYSFIANVLNDEMESQMIKYVVLKKIDF